MAKDVRYLLAAYGRASFAVKILIAGLVLSLLLGAGYLGLRGFHGISDWWANRRHNAVNASLDTKQVEIDQLRQKNAELEKELDAAYARGDANALVADQYRDQLTKQGQAAQQAAAKIEEAKTNYEADKERIAAPATLFARCTALCSERAGIKYPCKPSIEQYCSRYLGR